MQFFSKQGLFYNVYKSFFINTIAQLMHMLLL